MSAVSPYPTEDAGPSANKRVSAAHDESRRSPEGVPLLTTRQLMNSPASLMSSPMPRHSAATAAATTAAVAFPDMATDSAVIPAALQTRHVKGNGGRPPLASTARKESLLSSPGPRLATTEQPSERCMVAPSPNYANVKEQPRYSLHNAVTEDSHSPTEKDLGVVQPLAEAISTARKQSHYMDEAASRTSIHGVLNEPAESERKAISATRKESQYMAESEPRASIHGALNEPGSYPTEAAQKPVNAARKQSHYMEEAASRTSIHGALNEPAESERKAISTTRKESQYMAESEPRASIHGALNEPGSYSATSDPSAHPATVLEDRRVSHYMGGYASQPSVHAEMAEAEEDDRAPLTAMELLSGEDRHVAGTAEEENAEETVKPAARRMTSTERRRSNSRDGTYVPAFHPRVSAVAIDLDSVSAYSGEQEVSEHDEYEEDGEWYWEEVEEEIEETEEDEEEEYDEARNEDEPNGHDDTAAVRLPSEDRGRAPPRARGVEKGTNTVERRDEASQTTPYGEMVVYGPFPDALMTSRGGKEDAYEDQDALVSEASAKRRAKKGGKKKKKKTTKSARGGGASAADSRRPHKSQPSASRRGRRQRMRPRGHRTGWKCQSTMCDICHPWQSKVEAARAVDRAQSSVHAHRYCDYCGPVPSTESWATPWNETVPRSRRLSPAAQTHSGSRHRSPQQPQRLLLSHNGHGDHSGGDGAFPLLPAPPQHHGYHENRLIASSSATPHSAGYAQNRLSGSAPAASRALRLVNTSAYSSQSGYGDTHKSSAGAPRPNSGYQMPSRPTHPRSGYDYDQDVTYRYCDLTTGLMMLHRRGCPNDEPLYEYNDTLLLGDAAATPRELLPLGASTDNASRAVRVPTPPCPVCASASHLSTHTPTEQALRPVSPPRPIMSPGDLHRHAIDYVGPADPSRGAHRGAAPVEELAWNPDASGSVRRVTSRPDSHTTPPRPASGSFLPPLGHTNGSASIYSPVSTSLAQDGDVLMYNGRPFYNRVIMKQQLQRNRLEDELAASAPPSAAPPPRGDEKAYLPSAAAAPHRASSAGSNPVLYRRDMTRAAYRQKAHADEL